MKTKNLNPALLAMLLLCVPLFPQKAFPSSILKSSDILRAGKLLPDATLRGRGNLEININDLKGKIKIISVVPKLNTPVCDKQTHKFSETNGGLDKHVDIITVSTNSAESQREFAKKAKIHNLVFLSDNPAYQFGKKTGLLIDGLEVLRRTVIVADRDNIIRYVDFVPGGGLPNIKNALEAARALLRVSSQKAH